MTPALLEDTRDRILAAAELLFGRKGYAATSVREIVLEAGVTNPTLYYHFGSKQELFLSLIRERTREFLCTLHQLLEGADNAARVCEIVAMMSLRALEERPRAVRFIHTTLFGPQAELPASELDQLKAANLGLLHHHLERVAGDVSADRRAFAVMLTHSLIAGHALAWLRNESLRFDESTAAVIGSRVAAMLRDGLPVPSIPAGMVGEMTAWPPPCFHATASETPDTSAPHRSQPIRTPSP